MIFKIIYLRFGFVGDIWIEGIVELFQKPNILNRAKSYIGYEEDRQSNA